jgi:hypothetical protein
MRSLILVAATLFSCSVTANEAKPPSFDPASVPERLRVLQGRTAFIKIPSQENAPLHAAQGAVLRGNVPAEVVTPENTRSIPSELAFREREFDRFVQGHISETDLASFINSQSSTTSFVLLEDGAAVRIIAPGVNDGRAMTPSPKRSNWLNLVFLKSVARKKIQPIGCHSSIAMR